MSVPVPQSTAVPGPVPSLPKKPERTFVSLLIILAFWGAIYVAGMFSPPLLDDADSVHAEAAREMLQSHDWVTLHINNRIRYLEKAPLMYWSVAASYSLFGITDWSTRLPLIVGLLLLLAVTYSLGRRSYGERGGFYSALVLGTSVGPYLFTRFLIPEVLVALWLGLTFLFFLRSLNENPPSRLTCWGLAATCALNVLTKGLIGLVFPTAVILLYLLFTRNLRHLLRLRLFSSICVFLAVAAPWHILAAIRNPAQGNVRGFLWFYFVNEHFLRYLNKRVPRDYDTVPLLVYWALVLVWIVPWFVFLPQAVKNAAMRWHQRGFTVQQPSNPSLLFLLWALVIVVFFSFSTRQEYYTVPALPGLALLIGGWLKKEEQENASESDRRSGRISSLLLFVIGSLACISGVIFLLLSKVPPPGTDLAELLKKNPQDYALSFGHFFDLTPQAIGAFHGPLLVFSLALLLGTGLNWFLRRRAKPAYGNLALALMMLALLACVHSAFITFSPILSSKRLADALGKQYRSGDLVIVDGLYENASTLNFYTRIPLRSLHEPAGNLWFGSQFPDAPPVFEDKSSFLKLWNSEKRVFLWTDKAEPKELASESSYPVARSGGKSILTNHPLKKD
jgi:4-amino-4-deoxy-L-arabinose transferase-like glycosyltransferase